MTDQPYRHTRRRSRALSLSTLSPQAGDLPWWKRALVRPEPLHVDAGAHGELLVARIRIAVLVLLLPIPVTNLLLSHDATESLVGLWTLLVALGCAIGLALLLQRDVYRPWLGMASSLIDVSTVSSVLGVFLLLDSPLTAVNSRPTFECYFLAIGATALRYDPRVCLFAGLAAMLQYLGLVVYADRHWDLAQLADHGTPYGRFDWATQIARLILLGVAALLATAIVLRSQALRRLSRCDRLTGLPNRSYFDEQMDAILARTRRLGTSLAVAMIDVDHFKRYNDSHGHAAGDVALRAVALCIQNAVRDGDLVVRYGGEEFVAVLPSMGAEAAHARLEEIRRAVEDLAIPLPRQSGAARITISAGIASYGADGTQAEDLLDRADARLFEAKQGGRNRVVSVSGGEGRTWNPRPGVVS
jgi:diguanylate cyclase (GGDEF)-like protein